MVILLTTDGVIAPSWFYYSEGAVLLTELCAGGFIDGVVFFVHRCLYRWLYCSQLVLQVVVSQIFQKSQIHIYEESLFVILVHFVSMEAE